MTQVSESTITFNTDPPNAAGTVTWTNSNPSVVTLSSTTGRTIQVTAKAVGEAIITGEITHPGCASLKVSKTITVNAPPAANYSLYPDSVSIYPDISASSQRVTVEVYPQGTGGASLDSVHIIDGAAIQNIYVDTAVQNLYGMQTFTLAISWNQTDTVPGALLAYCLFTLLGPQGSNSAKFQVFAV